MYSPVIFLLVSVFSAVLSANIDGYDEHRVSSRVRRQSSECGVLSPNGALPWHSMIYSKRDTPYRYLCGGSLVSHTIVISAATCFWDNAGEKVHPPTDFAIGFGKEAQDWMHSQDVNVQRSDVAAIHVDPRYRAQEAHYQADIALVALTTPVEYKPYIKPVCFDFDEALEKHQLVGGNKGLVATRPLTDDDLIQAQTITRSIEVPYMPLDECLRERSFRDFITVDKICAGTRNGPKTICQGTSGSGLVFSNDSSKYFLRAILSIAPYTGNSDGCSSMAAFTLISKHESLIKEHFYDASSIQL